MAFSIRQLPPEDFPPLMREMPQRDIPQTLYIRGEMPGKEYIYLCVVGSRATSLYGRRMCASLIAGLARYPVAIVSGMALGIDGEAHKAALDVGLPTVAVLPSSLDEHSIYPSTNKALAQRILDYRTANGAFASLEALTAVSGIGERTIARLQGLVAFD